MIEEIQNTNNVEGIRSSKKDLNLALNSAFRHSSNQIRFQGLLATISMNISILFTMAMDELDVI